MQAKLNETQNGSDKPIGFLRTGTFLGNPTVYLKQRIMKDVSGVNAM
jgi:hypothetical protein